MPFIQRHFTPPSRRLRTFLRANRFFLAGVLALLAVTLYVLLTNQQGDVLIRINQLRTPLWDRVFIAGTKLGEPIAYLIVALVALTLRVRMAIFTIVTGAVSGIVAGVLKLIFAQARPMRWFFDNFEAVWHNLNKFEEPLRNWGNTSFPSGHTMSAFALFSFVCFNVRRPKRLISIFCFLVAAEVGFSRMYLLHHFLRDVTAGAAIGLLIGAGIFFLQWRVWPDHQTLDNGFWYE